MGDRKLKPVFGIVFALLCFAAQCLQAQKAYATLKPERIETGDTTLLFVIVSDVAAQPRDVDFVVWANVFPTSNILSRSEWRRSGAQWARQFTLIAFDSAKLELPPLTVLLNGGKSVTTNALSLNVFPTRGAAADEMAPIREIYRESVLWTDYWPWAAGGLAVLLLVFWFIKRRSKRPKPVVIPVATSSAPPVSATETALQKLRELQSRQLWKQGMAKEHHAEISMIVREYLEANYGVAALESTTAEILPMLASTGFSNTQVPLLKEVLQKTDMVKYAQSQLQDAVHDAVLEKARELVTPDYIKKQTSAKTPPPQTPQQKPKSGKYEPL